uniref:Uncharacterized protein n=1 Tax=Arundo donax TaxID=35708 RepID=A0A0A9BT51_ARUDO
MVEPLSKASILVKLGRSCREDERCIVATLVIVAASITKSHQPGARRCVDLGKPKS